MACIIDMFKILCFSLLLVAVASSPPTIFDVRSYGAKGDGKTDNAQKFLALDPYVHGVKTLEQHILTGCTGFIKAWKDACAQSGQSRIYIPKGTFYMSDVLFEGPCKGKIVFFIDGTLLAPVDPEHIKQDIWINFRYVDNLVVSGNGTIDGQGSDSWSSSGAYKNNSRPKLPANMGFYFVRYSRISGLKSLNSKAEHLDIFTVDHFNITGVNITAPGNSPNTDGIKIALSSNVKIWESHIGTGDDCIAILSGNTNFYIRNITCGPGHGISVGSLGRNRGEKNIEGFTVKDTVFTGTSDGIRFKTWKSPVSEITVSHFVYENIEMVDVTHPINIEQAYCPRPPCPKLGDSHIQIKNVTLKNVWGTSTNSVAVKMQCSKSFPCEDIQLIDINLTHNGPGPATALCENVKGSASGKMIPPSCLK